MKVVDNEYDVVEFPQDPLSMKRRRGLQRWYKVAGGTAKYVPLTTVLLFSYSEGWTDDGGLDERSATIYVCS